MAGEPLVPIAVRENERLVRLRRQANPHWPGPALGLRAGLDAFTRSQTHPKKECNHAPHTDSMLKCFPQGERSVPTPLLQTMSPRLGGFGCILGSGRPGTSRIHLL